MYIPTDYRILTLLALVLGEELLHPETTPPGTQQYIPEELLYPTNAHPSTALVEVQSRSIVHLENSPPRSNLRKITSSMCFQKFNPEVFLLRRLVSKDRKKLKVQTLHPDTFVQCKEQPVRSYYLSIWVEPLSQHLDNREIWHWQKLWLEFGGEIADYTVNCRIVHCCCYALISASYKKL